MASNDVITETIPPITFVQTGRVQEVPFEAGMTIAQAFRVLGIKVGRGQEIRLNNSPIRDQDATLNPGDQLMVVGNVSGG
jgi:hypothetical protein